MKSIVIVEQDDGLVNRPSLAAISAAKKLSSNIDLLVLDPSEINTIKNIAFVDCIYSFKEKQKDVSAESMVNFLKDFIEKYDYVIAPSGTFSKNFIPRLGAVLNLQPVSDIIKVHNETTFDRPIYAGNAIATVKSKDKKIILTIRGTAFQAVDLKGGDASLKILSDIQEVNSSKFISKEVSSSERPDLASAKIIISGGRGVGSKENFTIIEKFADKIGAAIGASRAAVDAGYISNDYQVGQTGKVVAPELYIAIGISGAIQHLAGMKDSKVIVAINKDEDAPIFQIADYGLVGDLFTVIPDITKAI